MLEGETAEDGRGKEKRGRNGSRLAMILELAQMANYSLGNTSQLECFNLRMSLSSQMLRGLDRISAIDARNSKAVRDCSVRTEVEKAEERKGVGSLDKRQGPLGHHRSLRGSKSKRSEGAKWGRLPPILGDCPIAPILLKIAPSHSNANHIYENTT